MLDTAIPDIGIPIDAIPVDAIPIGAIMTGSPRYASCSYPTGIAVKTSGSFPPYFFYLPPASRSKGACIYEQACS